MPTDTLKETVREKYGQAANRAASGQEKSSCCGSGGCGTDSPSWDPITSNLYDAGEVKGIPAAALLASLGCGNPTALASIEAGETVLDLGSGGGIDVLLSAKRVGPTGMVYGLDMTDEMLALANANKAKAGATNVEFLKGDIESIPLPDDSVDLVISNCVINLSANKDRVLSEAFRVLRPGGRFAVSDVVVRGEVPDAIKRSMELWIGCVAGAMEETEFKAALLTAGFENPSVEPTRIYKSADAAAFMADAGVTLEAPIESVDGKFMSAFVRATKPAEKKSCCGPECCAA